MSKKVNSCVKGKVFERAVVNWGKANGFPDMERTAQHCGKSGDAADVRAPISLPNLHLECKSVRSMNVGTKVLEDAMEQAWRDSPPGKTPVVIWRRSGSGMLMSVKVSMIEVVDDRRYNEHRVTCTLALSSLGMRWVNEHGERKPATTNGEQR